MSNIGYLIASAAALATRGDFTLYKDGTVLVDIPRISRLVITHTIDECGVVCHCKHTVKKRNGHLFLIPHSSKDLPEWVGQLNGHDPVLKREVASKGNSLCWKINCLAPLALSKKNNLVIFEHLQDHLETQIHIIEANQLHTLEWLQNISAVDKPHNHSHY